MKNDTTAFTFITLINNAPVHRVDLTKDGKKNTRDYAYGLAHYSVGSDFKAEVRYTDKTETTVAKVIIKNKTFNTIVAEYAGNTEAASALVHALDNRTMITRLVKTNGQKTQAELSKLARVM
ncbi:MAG: hypothetical protein J6R22_01210 [Alphaproteobacteria bacterium]|jgi:hypothetical protein|nr:hypothetical protein [Alphaproteobacteria bacterium]